MKMPLVPICVAMAAASVALLSFAVCRTASAACVQRTHYVDVYAYLPEGVGPQPLVFRCCKWIDHTQCIPWWTRLRAEGIISCYTGMQNRFEIYEGREYCSGTCIETTMTPQDAKIIAMPGMPPEPISTSSYWYCMCNAE